MNAIVDTNFVYALFDTRDQHHIEASAYFRFLADELLLPTVILSEVSYHLHKIQPNRSVAGSMQSLLREPFNLVDSTDEDYQRAIAILEKYHDSRIDFVDACIMSMAERLNVTRILTFDHRDFGMYRPSHIERFELLP